MARATAASDAVSLSLSQRERDELLLVLEQAFREGRVQERRTEAFEARRIVQERVNILESLLAKVQPGRT